MRQNKLKCCKSNQNKSNIKSVDREVRKKITVIDKNSNPNEEDNLELMAFVVAVPEGRKMSDISRKTMNRNLLSVSKSDTQEIQYEDQFTVKNRLFTTIAPLTLRIATRGQVLILLCDLFSIEVDSTDKGELYGNLQNEIYNYYLIKVGNNPTSNEAKTFYLYMNVVII